MPKIFTWGDNSNIECPFCGFIIHSICQGVVVEFNRITPFQKPCPACKKMLYLEAGYEIKVKAERTSIGSDSLKKAT